MNESLKNAKDADKGERTIAHIDIISRSLVFYLIFLVPFSVVFGWAIGGIFTFLTPFAVFVIIPPLDLVIGVNQRNPSPAEEDAMKDALPYKIVTWICAPVQLATVFWSAFVIAGNRLSPFEAVGLTVSVGLSSVIMGINASHELQHRVNSRFDPLLARFMLWSVGYMHWSIQHLGGHHRNVATPDDPTTARDGESFYAFWPRTVIDGFRNAWHIEVNRLMKKGVAVWDLQNRVIRYGAAEVALLLAFWVLLGAGAALFFVGQSIVAFSLLEMVNYIEHYGLLRREVGEGRYEPVNITHSWNSSNCLTNIFLLNLQRHSHHHVDPGRRYQVLMHFDTSPQLPTGYAGMILLALIPPWWRKVMGSRLNLLPREPS